jgi:arginyl-tRNA--protein-N-Asp/Glu arginylyltransferase
MNLLFSEADADYARYRYPYVIWALPEPGEQPADFFRRGFLPGSPQMDRFYLCRNLRVNLRRFEPSSENRRILRKGEGIQAEVVPRAQFDYSPARREAWKAFADARFGPGIMTVERLDKLMSGPVISHVLRFADRATGQEVGAALLFVAEPEIAFYYYAFYDLGYLQRNLGMFMMTRAVELFAERGFAHLHLGTCYSERALYKTQFAGIEFFNGFRWSDNLAELRFLLQRDQASAAPHLLEMVEFRDLFYPGTLADLAQLSRFRLDTPAPAQHPLGQGFP